MTGLNSLQELVLRRFFGKTRSFFLTGGAALSAAQLAWVLSQVNVGSDARIPASVTPAELRAFLEDLVSRLARLAYPATPTR